MIITLNKLGGGGASNIKYEIVDVLPSEGKKGIIYLTPKEDPKSSDEYDEWIWVNDTWENIGTSKIDLSDYYTKEEIDNEFATKQEIPEVPSYVSYFENDADYATSSEAAGYAADVEYRLSSVIEDKADKSDVENIQSELDNKVDKTELEDNYYTKEEIDTKIGDINNILNNI